MAVFSVATVNVNGLMNAQKRRQVLSYLKTTRYDVICLQETHQRGEDRKRWTREWGGKSRWCTKPGGGSRGVAILFRKHLNISIIDCDEDFNGRILRVTVEMDSLKFQIISIYGPNPGLKSVSEDFFAEIQEYCDPDPDVPCILLGDFNMVEDLERDRRGGNPRSLHTYGKEALGQFLDNHILCDTWRFMHPEEPGFSYDDVFGVESRLDRIYLPADWMEKVSSSHMTPFSWSDHEIVDAQFCLPIPVTKGSGFWKFNTNLLLDQLFCDEISAFFEWFRGHMDRYQNIGFWWDAVKLHFKRIAVTHSVRLSKKTKTERDWILSAIKEERAKSARDKDKIDELKGELRRLDTHLAKKVFVQTRMKFLEENEKPTKFFFAIQKSQEKKNCICKMHQENEDGTITVLEDQCDIIEHVASFYEKLYTKDEHLDKDLQKVFLGNIKRKLSRQQRDKLDSKLTKKELRDALFQTEDGSTPGIDGLNYEFWKHFWFLVEDSFYKMQDETFNSIGVLNATQRKSVISLLFKKGLPEDIANWRPISLLCCDYKVMAKAVANRLKSVLGVVIHEDQTCGIPGRTIFSNLWLIRDIIKYTSQKGLKGYLISVDQEKAFDRVDREFLYDVLGSMNFGPRFIQWVRVMYANSEACVLVNGHMSRFFPTTRGERQGCPASPLLFDIFEEPLAEEVRTNTKINGIPLPSVAPHISAVNSHYADDADYFIRGEFSLFILFFILQTFEQATGSKLKEEKTKGLCLGGAEPLHQDIFPIEWVNETGLTALGITFYADQLQTTNKNWSAAKTKLQAFCERSDSRKLSLKGKVLNLNMVGLAQMWHLATVIPCPKWIRSALDDIIFKYLWDGKHPPLARRTVYLPKERGGLGLLGVKTHSTALRTKFISMVVDKDCESKWVFLARYWIGFPIGRLHPDWGFLRENDLPKLDRPIYPEYYVDCLRFYERTDDVKKIPTTTREIRLEILDRGYIEPLAQRAWVSLGKTDVNWKKAWPCVYRSLATGHQQDIHYKFLHQILFTNKFCSRFKASPGHPKQHPFCDFCQRSGWERVEDVYHLFFRCKLAQQVWVEVMPVINLVTPRWVRRVEFLFSNFPPGISPHLQRLLISLLQITIQRIWLNRNFSKKKEVDPDIHTSVKQIFRSISHMVTAQFNSSKRRHSEHKFIQRFCANPQFCQVHHQGFLIFPFLDGHGAG